MTSGSIDLNIVDAEEMGERLIELMRPSSAFYRPGPLRIVVIGVSFGFFPLVGVSDKPELAKASAPGVCMDLWHACAGPLILLPKKGSAAVYFPQGHLEHHQELPAADATNYEVYALVSLVPDQQI